jgi:hypothetical protein
MVDLIIIRPKSDRFWVHPTEIRPFLIHLTEIRPFPTVLISRSSNSDNG